MGNKWMIVLSIIAVLLCTSSSYATGHGDVYGVINKSSFKNEDFLNQLASDVVRREVSLSAPVSDCYHTLFLMMPKPDLTSAEMANLVTFARLRNKVIVLVGENGDTGPSYNRRLNAVLGVLGTQTRFSTEAISYDKNGAVCAPSGLHDKATGAFIFRASNEPTDPDNPSPSPPSTCPPDPKPDPNPDPPSSGSCPPPPCPNATAGLRYLAMVAEKPDPSKPDMPWIVQEWNPGKCSVVAIHDNSMFDTAYVSNNLSFVHDLCVDRCRVELDIDSDNNNGFDPPARMVDEDLIENMDGQPGKTISINDDDEPVPSAVDS